MMPKKTLIVVVGPTASGKTSASIAIAKHLQTEIVSCDSRQFFREIPIGTAMPSQEELQSVAHHFIAHKSIAETYSAGQFERDFDRFAENFFQKNDILVLTGGSMLYEKAATEGLDEFPQVPDYVRNNLIETMQTLGISTLQNELLEKDPTYYEQVDLANPQRVIRALEIIRHTGNTFSSFRINEEKNSSYHKIKIGLQLPREVLYNRINRRVDKMLEQGLLQEAKAVYHQRELAALQTVGYKELFQYFDGTITLAQAIEDIKKNSRRYAKRQMTWYRKDPHIQWFEPDKIQEILTFIDQQLPSAKPNG